MHESLHRSVIRRLPVGQQPRPSVNFVHGVLAFQYDLARPWLELDLALSNSLGLSLRLVVPYGPAADEHQTAPFLGQIHPSILLAACNFDLSSFVAADVTGQTAIADLPPVAALEAGLNTLAQLQFRRLHGREVEVRFALGQSYRFSLLRSPDTGPERLFRWF